MILAAGLGTRLKPLTDTMPKALVPVAGKPMLEHLILKLKAAGFNEIIINVHHFANQIKDFLEANGNFGMKIAVSDETGLLLETGGGIKKAMGLLTLPNQEEDVLIHNVDILSDFDLQELIDFHEKSAGNKATLLVSKRITSRYLLCDKTNRLVGWINKNTHEVKPAELHYEENLYNEYAYSGIQIISSSIAGRMPEGRFPIMDFYLSHCNELDIRCYPANARILDIGKLDSLTEAEEFIKEL